MKKKRKNYYKGSLEQKVAQNFNKRLDQKAKQVIYGNNNYSNKKRVEKEYFDDCLIREIRR